MNYFKIITISLALMFSQCVIADPFTFILDSNFDGSITISDIGRILLKISAFPGNCIIYVLINYFPSLASFFEITYSSYDSGLSALFTIIAIFAFFYLLEVCIDLKYKFEGKKIRKNKGD